MNKFINKIFDQDAIQFLGNLSENCVDLIIMDPPYESLEKHRNKGTTTRLKISKSSTNQWFPTFDNKNYFDLLVECQRVLKEHGILFIFCDEETRDIILYGKSLLCPGKNYTEFFSYAEHNYKNQARLMYHKFLVWDKVHIGTGYRFRAKKELILYMEKKSKSSTPKQFNSNSIPDILTFQRLAAQSCYPAEKPYGLLELLINHTTQPDDLVVDPFCGSGNVGVAALRNKRNFILNDLYKGEAEKRIKAVYNE